MWPAWCLLALVVAQRLVELAYARGNEARLLAAGGVERDRRHYPLFVLLLAAYLVAVALSIPPPGGTLVRWATAGLAATMAGRLWTMAALGPRWTTRIVVLPGAPLVRHGPYRFLRHPNYLIVVLEIALLPLAVGAWQVALVFSVLNAFLLLHRIRREDAALAAQRRLGEAA